MLMQSIFDQASRFRILALGNGSAEAEPEREHISKERLFVELRTSRAWGCRGCN